MRKWVLPLILIFLAACTSSDADIDLLVQRAKKGNSADVKRLVRILGAGDRDRLVTAYRTLIEIGTRSEPFLMDGLRSKNPEVFEACAAALGNLGSVEAVGLLIDALGTGGSRRYAAAWALGEIGDKSAIEPLVAELGSSNRPLRKAAVRALVKMGPGVEERVAELLNAADMVSERSAIRVIGEIRGKESVHRLMSIGAVNWDAAVWALGRIGSAEALPILIKALGDERWEVRREAAQALGSMEDKRAAGALEIALNDDETVVREWAARSFETITGKMVLYRDENGDMVPPYNLYR